MFYVSDGKIYSMIATLDGKYPELKVEDGVLKPTGKSIESKPANRQVCSYEEVLAQFDGAEMVEVEAKPAVAKGIKEEPVVAKKTKV